MDPLDPDSPVQLAFAHFLNNVESLATSKGERRSMLAAQRRSRRARWHRGLPCMWPSCSVTSIPRSHSVPAAAQLHRIAEGGHVSTPMSVHAGGRAAMRVDGVGVNIASTFPGFCQVHERAFASFEQTGRIASRRDFALTFFRAVCREVRVREEQVRLFVGLRADQQRRYEERLEHLFAQSLRAADLPLGRVDFRALLAEHDERIECPFASLLGPPIDAIGGVAAAFRTQFLDPLGSEVLDGPTLLHMAAVRAPRRFPVSICGPANVLRPTAPASDDFVSWVLCWPVDDGTIVAICAPREQAGYAEAYFRRWTETPERLATMIDLWIAQGTEAWFMRPSVWNSLAPATRMRVESNLNDTTPRSINAKPDVSLFGPPIA